MGSDDDTDDTRPEWCDPHDPDHDHSFSRVDVEDPNAGTFVMVSKLVGVFCTACQSPGLLVPSLVHDWAASHRQPRIIWIEGWPHYPEEAAPRAETIRFHVGGA